MTALRMRLQKEVFDPTDEQLVVLVVLVGRRGAEADADLLQDRQISEVVGVRHSGAPLEVP